LQIKNHVILLCVLLIYSYQICSSILMLSFFSPQFANPEQASVSLERYAQMESISTNFWNVVNPTFGVRFLEVRSPVLLALDTSEETFEHLQHINHVYESASAAKRAHEKELENQSSIQRFGFQLIRRCVVVLLSINIPSVMILMTLIGIILWMLPPYREGYLEPLFQTFLARYGKYLVLAYISPKIPWAPLQRALKASQAAEYDKDGNHLGAISLQQNISKRQKTALGAVRIVTLSGHHAGDIQSLDCSSSHGTIISIGREGELVLWDGVRGKWVARLDRVQRRRDAKSFNGDVNPEYTVGGSPLATRLGSGPVRKIMVSSPIKCIKIDYFNQWIACGHESGLIRIWSISSSSWIRELIPTHKTNGLNSKLNDHSDIHIVTAETNGAVPTDNVKSTPQAQVVALDFIRSSTARDYPLTDMPKISRKHPAGKGLNSNAAPTYLIAAYADGVIREWDVETGECVNSVEPEYKSRINHLLVAAVKMKSVHERHRAFTASSDGTVTCYGRRSNDAENVNMKPSWRHLYTIKSNPDQTISAISAETSADGTGILVIGTQKGSVQVWSITNGDFLCTLAEGQRKTRGDYNAKISVRMPARHENENSHIRLLSHNENIEHTTGNQHSDHHGAVQHIAISRHCRAEQLSPRQGKFDRCHRNEFLIAASGVDGIVNIWRITYSKGNPNDRCDQCGMGSNTSVYYHKKSSSSIYNSAGRNDTPQSQPNGARREPVLSPSNQHLSPANSNTDQDTSYETSEEPMQDGVIDIEQLATDMDELQVKKSYLGRVYQPGGYGVVWLKSTILAGVRRSNTSSNGHSKISWELWMAPMRKYELQRRLRQNDSSTNSSFHDVGSKYNVPVIGVKLDNDDELSAPEADDHGLISRFLSAILSSNTSGRPQRRRQVFSSMARRMSAVNTARLQRTRRKQRNSPVSPTKNESDVMVEDETFTKELLPFTNVTCLESLDGDGFAIDFGNFVKVIWLDEQLPFFTLKEKDHILEPDSILANALRSRHSKKEKPGMSGPNIDDETDNREAPYLRRRSSSFSGISRIRLPCAQDDAACQSLSCEGNCPFKRSFSFPKVTSTVVSKKLN
jgi:WD40 repeat protein